MTDLTSLFLYSLPRNIMYVFQWRNALWHILAIGATLVIVISGLDWMYFEGTRWFARYLFPAVIFGRYVPMVFPIVSGLSGRISARSTQLLQRRRLSVIPHHCGICHGISSMDVISKQQSDAMHCCALRSIHWNGSFNDYPLVFGFRCGSNYRSGNQRHRRKGFQGASVSDKEITF